MLAPRLTMSGAASCACSRLSMAGMLSQYRLLATEFSEFDAVGQLCFQAFGTGSNGRVPTPGKLC